MIKIFYIVLLIWIAYIDFKKKQIPDFLIAAVGMCGIVSVAFKDPVTISQRILGMIMAFVIYFFILLCVPGSFGGGDVKLSMALGFYMGAEKWIYSFMYAVILSAAYIGILFLIKKYDRKKEIAFGPFLCIGALLAGFLR